LELEAPAHEVQITEYPIEMGASLVDHVRLRPVQLRMTAIVTNTPARESGRLAGQDTTEPNRRLSHLEGHTVSREMMLHVRRPIINTPPSAQLPTSIAGVQLSETVPVRAVVRTWLPEEQRIQRVSAIYTELQQAMREARQFIVATDLLGDFDRMLLKSLRTDRDNRSGTGLRLQMELQQVRYAELFQRDVSGLLPKPVKARSQKPKDEGKKPAVKPAAKPAAAKDSDLINLGKAFEGWVAAI
jgi:hypothetical protein